LSRQHRCPEVHENFGNFFLIQENLQILEISVVFWAEICSLVFFFFSIKQQPNDGINSNRRSDKRSSARNVCNSNKIIDNIAILISGIGF